MTEHKIDSFVQGIKCSTSQNIFVNITGIPTNRTSFDVYNNSIVSTLELDLSLTNKSTQNETRDDNSVDNIRVKAHDRTLIVSQRNRFLLKTEDTLLSIRELIIFTIPVQILNLFLLI